MKAQREGGSACGARKIEISEEVIAAWPSVARSINEGAVLDKIRELCRVAYTAQDVSLLPDRQRLTEALKLGTAQFKSLIADLKGRERIRCIQVSGSTRFAHSEKLEAGMSKKRSKHTEAAIQEWLDTLEDRATPDGILEIIRARTLEAAEGKDFKRLPSQSDLREITNTGYTRMRSVLNELLTADKVRTFPDGNCVRFAIK
jgi:hypothetical protein